MSISTKELRPQDLHNDLSSPQMTREELLEYKRNIIKYGIVKANILYYQNMSTEKLQQVANKKVAAHNLKEIIQYRGGRVIDPNEIPVEVDSEGALKVQISSQDDQVIFEPLPELTKVEEPKQRKRLPISQEFFESRLPPDPVTLMSAEPDPKPVDFSLEPALDLLKSSLTD